MNIELIDYLYYCINFDNLLNMDNIFRNNVNNIIYKILNTYRKILNIEIFIFDNKFNIKKNRLSNIIFEDLIFEDINYAEDYLKEYLELAVKNKKYIITEFKGVIVSIIPIFLSNKKNYGILLIDNSKGNIEIKNIKKICKEKNYNSKKYIEYFRQMRRFSKREFRNIVKTFWAVIFTFYENENMFKILKEEKIIKNIIKDIINNLPCEEIIKKAYEDYLDILYLENINISIKKYDNGEKKDFFQIWNKGISVNKLEIKEKLSLYDYDITKFIEKEEKYLKKHNITIKNIKVYLNKNIIEHIFVLKNRDNIILKKEDLKFLENIGKIILSYYLFKNKKEDIKIVDIFCSLIDNIDANIHIIDCETGKILYYNKNFAKEFNIDENKKEIFVQDLYSYDSRKIGEFYSHKLNKWFYNNTRIEKWIDNKEVIVNIDLDITDSKRKDNTINKLKWRNNISNLPNREKLIEDLNILFQESNIVRYVILINVDLFSRINFSHGYKYGNNFILQMANYLKKFNKNMSVYHLDGAEFVIITDSEKLTEQTVEIILNRFKKPWIVNSLEQYCTVSIGISKFPADGNDAELIIKNSTSALKRAKLDSKGKAFYFDTEADSNLIRRLQLEYFLRLAAMQEKDSFKVFYQPIINAKTGEITGAEALVRWADKEIGFIKPEEFIYLAEELGIINIIDNHVLEIACTTIKNINREIRKKLTISVNLSPVQLYEEKAHLIIKSIIDKVDVPYEYINLEITENTAVTDIENTKRKLKELKSLGIKISLDDFGTGYSSLNTLQEMPINTLKIDKHFIKNMKNSEYNYVFIKTMIELAHSTDIKVCCEGIENVEEWEELKKLNTDFLQGYLFSRPLPEKEFIDFIKVHNKIEK